MPENEDNTPSDVPTDEEKKFSDISGHWAEADIIAMTDKNIVKGDDMGNFNPKANCTKEEVVAVGVRLYEMMLERAK